MITIALILFVLSLMAYLIYYMKSSDGSDLTREEKRKKYKRICPRCGSENIHAYVDNVEINKGKVKTTYSINLNLFKPFTLINKNEKVVSDPFNLEVTKFVCDDCGRIFR